MNKFKIGEAVKTIDGFSKESNVTFATIIGETWLYLLANGRWYQEYELKKSQEELTQSELQFLTNHLSKSLSFNSGNIDYHKRETASYWKDCDKESGQTSHSFNMLNYNKEQLKKEKKLHVKLSEIQRKLKKQVGK